MKQEFDKSQVDAIIPQLDVYIPQAYDDPVQEAAHQAFERRLLAEEELKKRKAWNEETPTIIKQYQQLSAEDRAKLDAAMRDDIVLCEHGSGWYTGPGEESIVLRAAEIGLTLPVPLFWKL